MLGRIEVFLIENPLIIKAKTNFPEESFCHHFLPSGNNVIDL